jgi:hypothetical protein
MCNYRLRTAKKSCGVIMQNLCDVSRSLIFISGTIATIFIFSFPGQAQKIELEKSSFTQGLKQINKSQEIASANVRDRKLEKAIIIDNSGYAEIYSKLSFPASYSYNRIDLDGDKKSEIVVHLQGQYFCGSGGCSTSIYKQFGQNYKLITQIGPNRSPIIVSNNKTKGWSDLIIHQSARSVGVANQGYYVLKFNGRSYPENPGDGVKLAKKSNMNGRALFNDNAKFFELRP